MSPTPPVPRLWSICHAVGVGQVSYNRIAQGVSNLNGWSFHIHAAVKDIGIHQVRIERVLLGMLPESGDTPIVLGFDFANANTDLISKCLVVLVRMPSRGRAIISVEIDGEVTKNAPRQFTPMSSRTQPACRKRAGC